MSAPFEYGDFKYPDLSRTVSARGRRRAFEEKRPQNCLACASENYHKNESRENSDPLNQLRNSHTMVAHVRSKNFERNLRSESVHRTHRACEYATTMTLVTNCKFGNREILVARRDDLTHGAEELLRRHGRGAGPGGAPRPFPVGFR
jgi:hypothetical protein